MELTDQELEILVECVEAWEQKPMSEGVTGTLLGAMFCRGTEERERFMREDEQRLKQAQGDQKLRRERATLLKAKLIQLRQARAAERLGSE